MNRYEELLGPLSDEAERRVSVLLAAATGTDGVLTRDELVDAVASVIASSRSQARSIALALVQEAVEESLGSSYILAPESLTVALEGSDDLGKLHKCLGHDPGVLQLPVRPPVSVGGVV